MRSKFLQHKRILTISEHSVDRMASSDFGTVGRMMVEGLCCGCQSKTVKPVQKRKTQMQNLEQFHSTEPSKTFLSLKAEKQS